jgi:hypothetical protein
MNHILFEENLNGVVWKVVGSSCEKMRKKACEILIIDIKTVRGGDSK